MCYPVNLPETLMLSFSQSLWSYSDLALVPQVLINDGFQHLHPTWSHWAKSLQLLKHNPYVYGAQ